MPIPKPKDDEAKEEFIDRCMADDIMKEEYGNSDQRFAVCQTAWEKEKNNLKAEIEKRKEELGIRKNKPENRIISLEFRLKNQDESPKINGLVARFNSLSEDLGGFREKISPGCFKKTILEADVRALLNHNSDYVLGRTKSGTLKLYEDENGLNMECDPPDTQWARDLLISMKRGDINQCSFGFRTIKDDWDEIEGEQIRTLLEVEIFDVSIVTYPAYIATSASVRSLLKSNEFKELTEQYDHETINKHLKTLLETEPGKTDSVFISEPDNNHSEVRTEEKEEVHSNYDKAKARTRELALLEMQLKIEGGKPNG